MSGNPHPTDTFPYPGGSVVGILPDSAALESARRLLEQAGFDIDRCDELHGEDGLASIDVDGAAHGASGSLMRRLQSALSDEADHLRRYADALRSGQYVLGIRVGEDEMAKERAADALRAAPAEFLHYYAEDLDA